MSVISMELDSCHNSGDYNYQVAPMCFENVCIHGLTVWHLSAGVDI